MARRQPTLLELIQDEVDHLTEAARKELLSLVGDKPLGTVEKSNYLSRQEFDALVNGPNAYANIAELVMSQGFEGVNDMFYRHMR